GRKPTPQSIRRRSNNNRYETGRPQHVGKPTLAELQTKLDGVRREVRNLTVMGMDPKQPPEQARAHQGSGAVTDKMTLHPERA
ncbi:MAG: hypothetical protein WBW59_02000, partial [Pseudolabrys sp.]